MRNKLFLLIIIILGIFICSSLVACNSNNTENNENKQEISYAITIESVNNGTIIVNKTNAKAGEKIILNTVPQEDYYLVDNSLTYNAQIISNNEFVMPQCDVNITAEFVKYLSVSYSIDGVIKLNKKIKKGEKAPYPSILYNKYYLTLWYTDVLLTRNFDFNGIIENDAIIYGQRKFYPYNAISKDMNIVQWDSNNYFNITTQVVNNAAVSYFYPNYFYLYIEEGQTAIIATDTQYLNMPSNILLAISGTHGEVLNGGNFKNMVRTTDALGHVAMTFQVTQSGYYYVAVVCKNEELKNFDYIYNICATVVDDLS